jgi:serine/threonine protein phosphatase PrpC
MPLQLRVASETDIGLVRSKNQDSAYAWATNPEKGAPMALLIVSDGIGGVLAGEIASELATITVAQLLVPMLEGESSNSLLTLSLIESRLYEAMLQANFAVWRYTKENLDGEEMGCTLTCLLIYGLTALLGHVGDSRAYLLEREIIRQLTTDHTPPGELFAMGQIEYREMLYHPQRHVLTRAVGFSPMLDVDIVTHEFEIESRMLLCTDGLWAFVPEITLERLLSRPGPPRSIARELIAAANAFGGSDNIGVAICDARDPNLHRI